MKTPKLSSCMDATCAHCGAIFCRHCEGNLCPECGKQFQARESSALPRHTSDFRRYSYLCCLLHIFSDADGFRYRIERNGAMVQIWLSDPKTGKSNFSCLLFDDPEEKFVADFRHIIQKIVFFNA